jgi:hypothetical protein
MIYRIFRLLTLSAMASLTHRSGDGLPPSKVRPSGTDILHTPVHTALYGCGAEQAHLAICRFWGMLHRTCSYAVGRSCLPVFA